MPRLVPGQHGGTNVVWEPGEKEAYLENLRNEIVSVNTQSGSPASDLTRLDAKISQLSSPAAQQPSGIQGWPSGVRNSLPTSRSSITANLPTTIGNSVAAQPSSSTNPLHNTTAQLTDQLMLNMIDSSGRPSQVGWDQVDAALQAGSKLVDSTGQPFEVKQIDGGWVAATNQGWMPLQVLAGGQLGPGQRERIDQALQQGQLPQINQGSGGLGFGSLTQTFDEPFTGTGSGSGYTSKPYEEEFNFDYDSALQSPAFRRRLDEGRKLIENSRLGTSLLYSGRTGKEMMRFGQDLASDELERDYGRAWNQYQDRKGTHYANEAAREGDYNKSLNEFRMRHDIFKGNQNDIFNRYSTLAGLGQNSAANLGSTSSSFGNSIGNSILTGGAARAGGVINSANARTAGLSNLTGSLEDIALARRLGLI